jgi:hypothetical protein
LTLPEVLISGSIKEAPLNPRSSETFHDALLAQYRDLIHEAILESETEHKSRLDLGRLNAKLQVIYKAAQYDGLNETTISQLIDEAIPMVSSAKAA